LLTSTLRRLESPDSDWAAERTCDEADPVSAAPSFRRLLHVAGYFLRRGALTAAAMADEICDQLALSA
jgi:hypothetical protein